MNSTRLSIRRRLMAVFCGGFFGTVTRYLLSTVIQASVGKAWPYDILLINITGAFLLALITTLADATTLIGPTRRLFINVGFLGAYTTFSSLALGDILLFVGERWVAAFLYLFVSITGGVVAILLGDTLGQWLVKRLRKELSTRRTRKLTGVLPVTKERDHLDIQDDVLLPDEEPEQQTKRLR